MDGDDSGVSHEPDGRIDALIDEYFARREAGEALSPDAFADEHRDLADVLRPHLEGIALLEDIRESAPEVCASEAPTLPSIPGYRILEELGRGGMGVVYRAMQLATKRVVAVKVMLAGPFSSPSARHRFEREVELAARLTHPNIVRVLESGRVERQPYYAMDYVAGVSLDRYVEAAQLDVRAILVLVQRVCDALEYAHEHDVIHRDLKPANVLVDSEGAPYVLDFGLAKAINEAAEDSLSARMTAPGQVMGTLPYLAPEQAAGATGEIDARTDVYALGVILYEALSGSLPFDATDRPSDLMRRILETAPPRLSGRSSRIGDELETIVLKALAKERARRYQSAGELGADIRRYLDGEPILAKRPSSLYVLRKKVRKHPIAVAVTGMAVILGAGWLAQDAWSARRAHAGARTVVLLNLQAVERATSIHNLGRAESLLREHPALPDARLLWAQSQYRNEESRAAAILHLERALADDHAPWAFAALLGECYEETGDPQRARALAARAERDTPNTADAWYLRSLATLDPARAIEYATRTVERAPSHRLAWRRLAVLRRETGDLDGALAAADRLIELGDPSSFWDEFKGQILAMQGRFHEAVVEYTRALSRDGPQRSAYAFRAHAFRWLREYEKAVADYDRVIEGEDAPDVWHVYQRATPLWILGRRAEAVEDYRRVRIMLGRASYGDARRFLILRELGRDGEAAEVLDAARRDVTDAWPWLAEIFRCLAGGITPDTLVAIGESDGDPEHVCEAYYYAAETALILGQPERARPWFEQCVQTGVQFDPDSTPALPMNEHELARWRLETRLADVPAAAHGD